MPFQPPRSGEITSIPSPDDVPGTGKLIVVESAKIRNDSGITLDPDSIDRFPTGWKELPEYSENWETDNNEATRTFEGPWSGRKQFVDYLLGIGVTDAASPSGTRLTRLMPAQHPEYPWLYATSVRDVRGQGLFVQNPNVVDQVGNHLNMIAFIDYSSGSDALSCRLQVRYQALNYEVRTDGAISVINTDFRTELHRYVERQEHYALKSLPIPKNSQLRFVGGANAGQPIPATAGNINIPLQELTYIWHRVPDPPTQAFADCQGKVNDSTFDPQVVINGRLVGMVPGGYAAETLLCLTPQKQRHRGPTGRVEWTITYKFLYNPFGFNNFPDANGTFSPAKYVDAKGKPTDRSLYAPANFNKLFLPPDQPFNYQ